LLDQSKRLLNRKLNILIHGETGTGKEVIAKALHRSSVRANKPFVAVNCGAIPESLIESELFGYTAGAFTGGRTKGMKGLILQSDGGTLFLDEIGDMPLHLQTRLLRVLSEKEVLPLGADKPVPVDLTVIAASHRDLRNLIGAGSFREDLYYRLCGATLHLPALRDRADKRYLIEKVLAEESELLGMDAQLSLDAMHAMLCFAWPCPTARSSRRPTCRRSWASSLPACRPRPPYRPSRPAARIATRRRCLTRSCATSGA
jgi:transcriptional regulator with PAS, ATPase and Fis domain